MDHSDPNAGYLFFAVFAVVWVAVLAIMLLFVVVYYVVMSFALMKLFAKVGIEPWSAWLPFYGTWKWLELGGQPGWFSLLSLVPYGSVVTSVFLCIGMWRTGIAFRKDGAFLVLGIVLPFVWAFLLGRDEELYDPELIVQAGYPRPLAGYGSAATAG